MPYAGRLVGAYRFPAPPQRCRTATRTRQRLALQPRLAVNSAPRHSGSTNHAIRPVSPNIFQQHSKRTCPKCLWARCRQRWMRATPLHPTHYMRTSWLEVRPSTSRSWALGCWVCRQAIGNNDGHAGGPFVTCSVRRPNKARIKKHHRSSYHQRSVCIAPSSRVGKC